jgi:8-oxo-dGTP pyrophosphatase MutT (NUDIX family)
MAKRRKALVWVLRPAAGGAEVLLLLRPARRGGGLHPVTGKADGAESFAAAAAREVEEETGLSGPLVDLRFAHQFEVPGRGAFSEAAFLLSAPAGVEPRLSDEHVGHRWVTPAAARALLEWAAHRESLRLAVAAFG